MNKFISFSVAAATTLMVLTVVIGPGSAQAGELFDPQNTHLSQSVHAPGSRFFVSVDDETAVTANERYVSIPVDGAVLFSTTDRQAIAQWLAWAERERPMPLTPPAPPAALEAFSPPAVHHANVNAMSAPLRAIDSIGPLYAQ